MTRSTARPSRIIALPSLGRAHPDLGFLGGAPAAARTNYLLIKGIEAIGVRIGGLNEAHPEIAAANVEALVELAAEGKLKPRIWRSFPLERAGDAIQALIDRAVIGKSVLVG